MHFFSAWTGVDLTIAVLDSLIQWSCLCENPTGKSPQEMKIVAKLFSSRLQQKMFSTYVVTFFIIGTVLLVTACSDGHDDYDTRSPLSLRELADGRGILIGSAVGASSIAHDMQYIDTLAAEFSSITPENAMKWSATEPEHGSYTWENADSIVAFATAYNQAIRGHTLVWPNEFAYKDTPDYVSNAPDAETMQRYIDDHIEAVVNRYADVVDRWDVVNEPLETLGSELDQNVITATLGEGWIVRAFQQVRRLDPSAKLYLNESLAERPGEKHQGLLTLVRRLISAGAPIDGIGLQSHFLFGPPSIDQMVEVMRDWETLGLDVAITELDIPVRQPGKEEAQATSYGNVVAACLSVETCREITFWGFTDKYSWLNSFLGPESRPLLFDENYKPKPAYFAVHAALVEQE